MQDLSTGASYPSMPRLSWLVKLCENLTYVCMWPAPDDDDNNNNKNNI